MRDAGNMEECCGLWLCVEVEAEEVCGESERWIEVMLQVARGEERREEERL